ncbi:hypothetical protein CWS43_04010 [Rahnella sp. AA]|nr:hypothetical protein CWS43_04010 [Rahnella sp. AA]
MVVFLRLTLHMTKDKPSSKGKVKHRFDTNQTFFSFCLFTIYLEIFPDIVLSLCVRIYNENSDNGK